MGFVIDHDFETPALYERVGRKARKEHRCEECQRPIRPGERYIFHKGLSDGSWWQAKICSRCTRVREALEDEEIGNCLALPFGEMRSALRERCEERRGKRVVR